jgi:K+-sensing histidine kinase KdpD
LSEPHLPAAGRDYWDMKITQMSATTHENIKSVKSMNLCQSVVKTIFDIIKANGGELKVVTKEGEGSEFMIQIPRN